MHMKPRAGGRLSRNVSALEPSASDVFVRAGDFGGVWISEPPAADGASEIYFVVAGIVLADRDRNWVGDVSVFAVNDWMSQDPTFRVFTSQN